MSDAKRAHHPAPPAQPASRPPAQPPSQAAAPHPAPSHPPVALPQPQPPGAGASLLFLREEQMRLAQDLLFFAYRDFTGAADAALTELGLGRAHHRALHFIGRNPGITVSDLLALLRITKQSLARVLSALVAQQYVSQATGRTDRRQRLLSLTAAGEALERHLFERQRDRLASAYRDAGGPAVEGFRRVLRAIADEHARAYLDAHEPGPRVRSI